MANQGFLIQKKQTHRPAETNRLKGALTVLFVLVLFQSGCATSTTFRVFDQETRQPIQGAVGIAMWTSTRGLPGLTYSYTSKAIEAESDPQGFMTFPAVYGSHALSKPHVKVYKPGYVGWDSELIYIGCAKKDKSIPIYKTREKFSWRDQDVFLEQWRDEYTFISHYMHISTPPDVYEAGLKTSKYEKAIEYEDSLRSKERGTVSK